MLLISYMIIEGGEQLNVSKVIEYNSLHETPYNEIHNGSMVKIV